MVHGMRAVALLRGINVGTGTRVPMAEVRALAEGLGLTDVATYVQSGNVVFTVPSLHEAQLASSFETAIASAFTVQSKVLIRTESQLAGVAAAHPFEADEPRPAMLHVVFLRDARSRDDLASLDPARSPGDRFVLTGRELYLHYAKGSGRSKLTLDYIERRLGTVGTARNWNTVQKLVEMVRGA